MKELIAGITALAVAAIGYRQWKRGVRSGTYLQDKEQAYKSIWLSLEEIHLFVRKGSFSEPLFNELVFAANSQMIKFGLHLVEADRAAAARYISSLKHVGEMLATLPHGSLFHQEVATTGKGMPVPPELLKAWNTFEKCREDVITRFRLSIGAYQI